MIFKPRTESSESKACNILNVTMNSEKREKWDMTASKKGYEGENQFDALFVNAPTHWLFLNDLLLEVNNSKFQIDSLLITSTLLYLFEVKNFQGDYYIEDNHWKMNGKEAMNPLLQLQRCETVFRQFLQKTTSEQICPSFPTSFLLIQSLPYIMLRGTHQ